MAGAGMKLEVRVDNLTEIQDYLKELPDDSFNSARKVFGQAVLDAHKEVQGNLRSPLNVRSGTLARSIQTVVTGDSLSNLSASLFGAKSVAGKQLVYTLTQEFGATIKAKRAYMGVPGGPYLNIPMKANKTAAGVTRLQAREVFNQGGYIAGRGVFLNGRLMFALVKSVKIPARLGMTKAGDNQVDTLLSRLKDLIGEG